MELSEELKQAKLDEYFIGHVVRRNIAIGTTFDYGLTDFIFIYEAQERLKQFKEWTKEATIAIRAIMVNNKCRALEKVIQAFHKTTDINEKRAYLLDALHIEEEINDIFYSNEV